MFRGKRGKKKGINCYYPSKTGEGMTRSSRIEREGKKAHRIYHYPRRGREHRSGRCEEGKGRKVASLHLNDGVKKGQEKEALLITQ